MLALSLATASLTQLALLAGAAAVALLLGLSSGLGPGRILRRSSPIVAFVALILLLTPFTAAGGAAPLFPDWPQGPTRPGLILALAIALRVAAVTLLAIAALDVAPLSRSLGALAALRVPAILVHTALLTQRTLTRFREDLARMRLGLLARGFRPGPNPRTLGTFAGVSGGLLVRSVGRAERLERAMRCRGYAGQPVFPPPSAWRLGDTLLLGTALLAALGLVLVDRLWLLGPSTRGMTW